jgi:hypothetical protein
LVAVDALVADTFVRLCVKFVSVVLRSSSKIPESPRERFVESAASALTIDPVRTTAKKGPKNLPAFINKDTPVYCFGETSPAILSPQ